MAIEHENIKISIWDHLKTQLAGTYTVAQEGTRFDKAGPGKWIEWFIIDISPERRRKSATIRREDWLVQLSAFVKTGPGQQDTNEVFVIEDAIGAALDEQVVAIKAWDEGGDPQIGTIDFGQVRSILASGSDRLELPGADRNTMQRAIEVNGIAEYTG